MNTDPDKRHPAVKLTSAIVAGVGAVALATLIVITMTGVTWRYVLRDPIFGIEDLASLSLAVLVAAGVALAAIDRAHIAVDLLSAWLDRGPIGRGLTALAAGMTSAICLVAIFALHLKAACGVPCGEFTSNLSIPHAPFYYGFAIAFAVFAFAEARAALLAIWRKK